MQYIKLINDSSSSNTVSISTFLSFLIWPAIVIIPLLLTYKDLYLTVFPEENYVTEPTDYWNTSGNWPSPLGLCIGIFAVAVGQIMVILYFILFRASYFGNLKSIQKIGPPAYEISEGIKTHLFQPEGFVLLVAYLSTTWMFGLMPKSYYSFTGGINWFHVMQQLLIQDAIQYLMHIAEHKLNPEIYKASHKPHHRFTNPRIFDAFNGSVTDTILMIIVPFLVTARLVNANVWSYMTFGSLYSCWLVLIHSEYSHNWDTIFSYIGFGTAADHHVHHKLFTFNYGHLFMYWDIIGQTYKNPHQVHHFNN